MSETLRSLAVLACPVGMGVMMWVMVRGRGRYTPAAQAPVGGAGPGSADSAELARLRAELDQLQAAQRDLDAGRVGEAQPKDGLR